MKKYISIILLLLVIVIPVYSYADCPAAGNQGFIQYPGKDLDGTPFYVSVFTDHLTLWGGVGSAGSCLPLQYPIVNGAFSKCGEGTGTCFALTTSSRNLVDIAIRNSWMAVILKAEATKQKATVAWAVTEGQRPVSLGNCYGCLLGVSTTAE